jgi:hypothetical protein
MELTKQMTLVYAQGFVGDYIETHASDAEPDVAEHMQQLMNMWQIVSNGLDQLRRENTDFEMKHYAAKLALE